MASNALPRRLNIDDEVPARGSVVMVHGLIGTAFQRLYSDGLFHSATRQNGVAFAALFRLGDPGAPDNVFLVHDAALYEGAPT